MVVATCCFCGNSFEARPIDLRFAWVFLPSTGSTLVPEASTTFVWIQATVR